MNFLRLSYLPEDEWHGEVRVSVQSDGFGGRGAAWFSRSQIDDFVARLEPCPILDGQEPALAGGYFREDGGLAEELLGIRIVPHNATGTLRVIVHLETWMADGSDQKQELNAVLLTTYADVVFFKSALAAHLAGSAGEAALAGQT